MQFKPLRPESNQLLHLDAMRFIASAGIRPAPFTRIFSQSRRKDIGRNAFGWLGSFRGFVFRDLWICNRACLCRPDQRSAQLRTLHPTPDRAAGATPLVDVCSRGKRLGFFAYFRISATHAPSFSAACLLETVSLTHAIFPCDGILVNAQSWSISAEMAMYFCFPIFLAIGRRSPFFLLVIAAGVAVGIVGFNSHGIDAATSVNVWISAYAPLRAVVSFCIGIFLWLTRSAVARFPAPELVLYVAAPALFILMQTTPNAILTLSLVYVVVFMSISADLRGGESRLIKAIAPMGQLTYSIYMWHWLLILTCMNIIGDKILHATAFYMTFIAIITYSLILICSYMSFIYIETPARRWIDRLKVTSAAPTLSKNPAAYLATNNEHRL